MGTNDPILPAHAIQMTGFLAVLTQGCTSLF